MFYSSNRWLSFQQYDLTKQSSPHLRLTVPLSIDDISGFGDGLRELFIKSSSYSVITIEVSDSEPTISWMFSSEPKSISFSVVYRESADTQVEQSKVPDFLDYESLRTDSPLMFTHQRKNASCRKTKNQNKSHWTISHIFSKQLFY